MNFRGAFLQTLNQTVDSQSRIWYVKHQAKVHRDLRQRIPPFFGSANPISKKESVLCCKRKYFNSKSASTIVEESYPQGATRAPEILPFLPTAGRRAAPLHLRVLG